MNPLVPALGELARIIRRQIHRLQLTLDRRKLAQLETALGLLGWQQADYDESTQTHVSRLTDYEREQARLTNESAAIGLQIQQIEERRGVAEREAAEAAATALEREQPGVANEAALDALLGKRRKERKEIEARLPQLDREYSDAEEKYRELVLPELPSPQLQAQLLELRKVILSIPSEKAEWVAKLQQTSEEIAAMETLHAALQEARARFEKQDDELRQQITSAQWAKRKVEQQIEALEKAKADPYREIGRALADNDVAPLNQPDALKAVRAQRQKISACEAVIDASLAESARSGQRAVLKTWLIAFGLIVAGAAVILAIAVR